MRKLMLISVTVLLLNCINVSAQRGPIIGIGGSVNSDWVLYPNAYAIPEYAHYVSSNYKSTIGGDFYVAFTQNFVDVFGIRAELQSSTLGQDYSFTDGTTGSVSSKNVSLHYIEIPVMARIATTGARVKVHLMAGPQIGFLSSATQSNGVLDGKNNVSNQQIGNGGGIYPNSNSQSSIGNLGDGTITNRYNSTDFLVVAEIGVDIFIIDPLFINVGLRVHYGLTDINAKSWQFNTANVAYNSSNNIYGGITFGVNYILKYWYR